MPGPFPGMDPYLESTLYWRKVHGHLLSDMTYFLNEVIRPLGFVAQLEERCYLVPLPGFVYPDSVVLRSPQLDSLPPVVGGGTAGTISATAVEATPPLVLHLHPEEVREPYIEIRTVDDDEPVVTVIELLSPSNKAAESIGRNEYLDKQRAALGSRSHLLEIDLLRDGAHTVAAPRDSILALARRHYDYVVILHRAGNGGDRFELWPFTVREAMPAIRVPLAAGAPDVIVPLQSLFDRMYDRSGVGDRLNYAEDAEPPLSPADSAWADALLRDKGLRK